MKKYAFCFVERPNPKCANVSVFFFFMKNLCASVLNAVYCDTTLCYMYIFMCNLVSLLWDRYLE